MIDPVNLFEPAFEDMPVFPRAPRRAKRNFHFAFQDGEGGEHEGRMDGIMLFAAGLGVR